MKTMKPVSMTCRTRQAGQSLTVAIIVLFLLLFLAGLFIALVVNNLRNASSASSRSTADRLAQAGIEYLDKQLTEQPVGADWRPEPTTVTNESDPDYPWLKPCDRATSADDTCGYTRVDFGADGQQPGNQGGRALVKITYDPNGGQPSSKYLRLDSVGRVGQIVADDPTTYGRSESLGLRRDLVALKSIGLNEYLRYITNKDNRPAVAALGAIQQAKDTPAGRGARPYNTALQLRDIESYYYGPVRVNGSLTFYGANRIFLDPRRNDALEVAGSIVLNNVDGSAISPPSSAVGNPARVYVANLATGSIPTTPNVLPSTSTNFSTLEGLVRDNAVAGPESNLRAVSRTQAPLIDTSIGSGGLTRYRALTQYSAPGGEWPNPVDVAGLGPDTPGQRGWGQGLYIDNRNDSTLPSNSLFGAYSPRTNWLTPGSSYWTGDFKYDPPAVDIELTPRAMILNRKGATGRSYFFDPQGRRLSNNSTVVRYTHSPSPPGGPGYDPNLDNVPQAGYAAEGGALYKFAGYPASRRSDIASDLYEGEYVVFAEGNVRIKGVVGGLDAERRRYFLRHLTIVSNGTIFIDGSVLRDNIDAGDTNPTAAYVRGRSSIALLAKQYVAVNTTQFFSPGAGQWARELPGVSGGGIELSAAQRNFDFGLVQAPVDYFTPFGALDPSPGRTRVSAPYMPAVYVRHLAAVAGQVAPLSLFVNEASLGTPNLYNFGGTATFLVDSPADSGGFRSDIFPLNAAQLFPNNAYPIASGPAFGTRNRLSFYYDPSAPVPEGTVRGDYRLARLSVAPMDVRIEALLYAQEGSLFIIPGPWLNPNPNDTFERYTDSFRNGGTLASFRRADEQVGGNRVNPRFPFYGEPQDIRITFFGAITENLPAEVGDQAAWLEKWGWIPTYQGSTGLPSAPGYPGQESLQFAVHGPSGILPGPGGGARLGGGTGILYIFDDRMIAPYGSDAQPLRRDSYGNTLPIAPCLPVAPGLLYTGENTRY
jgi:hypothetical protein